MRNNVTIRQTPRPQHSILLRQVVEKKKNTTVENFPDLTNTQFSSILKHWFVKVPVQWKHRKNMTHSSHTYTKIRWRKPFFGYLATAKFEKERPAKQAWGLCFALQHFMRCGEWASWDLTLFGLCENNVNHLSVECHLSQRSMLHLWLQPVLAKAFWGPLSRICFGPTPLFNM